MPGNPGVAQRLEPGTHNQIRDFTNTLKPLYLWVILKRQIRHIRPLFVQALVRACTICTDKPSVPITLRLNDGLAFESIQNLHKPRPVAVTNADVGQHLHPFILTLERLE